MFDIGSAVVLGLVLAGLVTMGKTLVEGPNKSRISVGACLVLSIVTVLIVSASEFGKDQVVLDRSLDSLDFWSQIVVALLLAGIASGIWEGFTAIKNIGVPMPTKAQVEALDKATAEYAAGQMPDAGGAPEHGVDPATINFEKP